MAIDTADRRASTVAGWLDALRVLPAPDGTVGAADRVQDAGGYRGLGAGGDGDGRITVSYRLTVSFGPGQPVAISISQQ